MSDENKKLEQVRNRIDALDNQIQKLISERAACAKEVARIKGHGEGVVYYRPEREAQVLRCVKDRNSGELPDTDIVRIFREIMSSCLALEQQLTSAFLGPEGSFTQEATLKHFGHAVNLLPQVSLDDVFREVEVKNADYGVVAVENSTEGSVTHTLDMLSKTHLKVCGEVELRIHHHLMSRESDLSQIKVVYAHQQALAQCRNWLFTHLNGVAQYAVNSNAEAARRATTEQGAAAIAGLYAAEVYEHNILASNIEDNLFNKTRFLVIGQQFPPPSGKDKTSLLVMTGNQPGALYRILTPFAKHGLSMSKIESRPSKKEAWEYVFFIDIEGHVNDSNVAGALSELMQEAQMVKVLGSYPKAVI
jgi:chorismate mutase/prephenate dehydratase